MSRIFALAGMSASDYQFVNTAQQELLYDATQLYLNMVNEDVARAMQVFIQGVTENHTERYKLPGDGLMPERADGVNSPAVKAIGSWDTAYPLRDYGSQVAATDIEFAYMTPQEYQLHIDTVVNSYRSRLRQEILHVLFDNVAGSFTDPKWGALTVQPLANADAVVYPPVLGSRTEATDNHYLESGYAAASISDTNDPYPVIVDELEEHFGEVTGGSNIVVFINPAERPKTEALTNFTPVPDNFLVTGDNIDVPTRLPYVPGKVLGRHDHGAWVVQWRWIPANYMLAIHLEVPAPLKMRVDPAATGLPQGLALVAQDAAFPIRSAEWRARFGIGAANRLNGVAFELGSAGTYTIPTAYD